MSESVKPHVGYFWGSQPPLAPVTSLHPCPVHSSGHVLDAASIPHEGTSLMKSVPKVLVIIGLTLFGLGLGGGFIPVKSQGVTCGSAFVESNDPQVAAFTSAITADAGGYQLGAGTTVVDTCADARSVIRVPVVAFLVVGGLMALLAAIISSIQKGEWKYQTPADSAAAVDVPADSWRSDPKANLHPDPPTEKAEDAAELIPGEDS